MKRTILHVVLIAGIFVLAYLVYNSINKVTSFNAEEKQRQEVVQEKLIHIRDIQAEYKKKHKKYASNWDTLMSFLRTDSLPLVMKTGRVPDTLTEMKALEMGIVTRDTNYILAKDTLFTREEDGEIYEPDYELEELPVIPFSSQGGKVEPDTFKMNAGEIDRGNIPVPVLEVVAPKESFLKGMNEELIAREKSKDMKIGSMEEATTDGNWE